MRIRTLRLSLMVFAALVLTADRAWPIGFVLGESKEELKLKYDVAVQDHGTGRVTVVLTLADEGRLNPLDDVQLVIPDEKLNEDGNYWVDLAVSIDIKKTVDGKRVGQVHLRKDLAERAQIRLNTRTMDGKLDARTQLHHVIPIAKYLKNAPAPTAAAEPSAAAPPATKRKKD